MVRVVVIRFVRKIDVLDGSACETKLEIVIKIDSCALSSHRSSSVQLHRTAIKKTVRTSDSIVFFYRLVIIYWRPQSFSHLCCLPCNSSSLSSDSTSMMSRFHLIDEHFFYALCVDWCISRTLISFILRHRKRVNVIRLRIGGISGSHAQVKATMATEARDACAWVSYGRKCSMSHLILHRWQILSTFFSLARSLTLWCFLAWCTA